MDFIHAVFKSVPETALFLSLAIGYAVGKINFGKFQIGGVGGSLIAAVLTNPNDAKKIEQKLLEKVEAVAPAEPGKLTAEAADNTR